MTRDGAGEWAGDRVPDCHSSNICSSRPNMRASKAMIMACTAAGNQPQVSCPREGMRRCASWSPSEGD